MSTSSFTLPEPSHLHIRDQTVIRAKQTHTASTMMSCTMVSTTEVVTETPLFLSLSDEQGAAPKVSELQTTNNALTPHEPSSLSKAAYNSTHGSLQPKVQQIVKAKGNYFHLADGSVVFDAVGGAAVTSIGHGDERVKNAICNQIDTVEYCRSTLFSTKASEDLAAQLVRSTNGAMQRAMIVSSGTFHAFSM